MNGHLITKLMVAIFFYVTIWKPSFNIICIRLLFYLQGIQHDLNYLHYFNLLLIDSVHIYTKMFIFTAKLHFKMLEFFFTCQVSQVREWSAPLGTSVPPYSMPSRFRSVAGYRELSHIVSYKACYLKTPHW